MIVGRILPKEAPLLSFVPKHKHMLQYVWRTKDYRHFLDSNYNITLIKMKPTTTLRDSCSPALDGSATFGTCHVLCLHFHGHPLSYQGVDAKRKELGL